MTAFYRHYFLTGPVKGHTSAVYPGIPINTEMLFLPRRPPRWNSRPSQRGAKSDLNETRVRPKLSQTLPDVRLVQASMALIAHESLIRIHSNRIEAAKHTSQLYKSVIISKFVVLRGRACICGMIIGNHQLQFSCHTVMLITRRLLQEKKKMHLIGKLPHTL